MKTLALEIYDKYFKAAQAQPRGVFSKLSTIVAQLEIACQRQIQHPFKSFDIQVISNTYNISQ